MGNRQLIWGRRIALLVFAVAALCLIYSRLFDRFLPESKSWFAVAGAALLMLLPTTILYNITYYLREITLLSKSEIPKLEDGKRVAVCGTLFPVDQPLLSPFSNQECVAYSFGAYVWERKGKNRTQAFQYMGNAVAPCRIHTPSGDLRVIGLMEGTGKKEYDSGDAEAYHLARQYLNTHHFEDLDGGDRSRWTLIKELITQSEAAFEKNYRVVENPAPLESCLLEESYLTPGNQYCIIGVWAGDKRALIGDPLGQGALSVIDGDRKAGVSHFRNKTIFALAIGLFLIVFINFWLYGFLHD